MSDYYKTFHDMVMLGICCGLRHPIEWWVNAMRTPGGFVSPEYYENIEKIANRYFTEMYCDTHMIPKEHITDEDIIKWLTSFYKEDHFFKDSFDAMMTNAFLKSKEQKDGHL